VTEPLLVSVFSPDRTGLIAAITGTLFDLGANLGDTSFAVLGEGAEFTSVCEFQEPPEPAAVEQALRALPELESAELRVIRFALSPEHGPSGNASHRIHLRGGDHPGLIARLSETFIDYDGNIVRLHADRIRTRDAELYAIDMDVCLSPGRAEACLAAIANTASNLQMSCEWEALSGD
jgi:glycine cleavage system transcriptional repressor